jgi:hypothetical protein
VKYQSPSTYHSKDIANVNINVSVFNTKVKVTSQTCWYPREGLVIKNKILINTIQKILPRLKFSVSGLNTKVKVTGQTCWYPFEGLVTSNTHGEYQNKIMIRTIQKI